MPIAATYCANVQLHSALAEYEIAKGAQGDPRYIQPDGSLGGLSYVRCTEACRATALVATLVADIDLQYMYMFIGLAWVCVAQVLTREVPRLRRSGQLEQANEKERQLAIMERSMERLVATYPVLGEWFNVRDMAGLSLTRRDDSSSSSTGPRFEKLVEVLWKWSMAANLIRAHWRALVV
jgi:hypothetical protein